MWQQDLLCMKCASDIVHSCKHLVRDVDCWQCVLSCASLAVSVHSSQQMLIFVFVFYVDSFTNVFFAVLLQIRILQTSLKYNGKNLV